ncbi:tail fiber domain-containing protein [Tritonibacter mobilis]|uniref:tail fiber domain-containing protein n=1 Tax=Tritonibacter mobilis TaxID=379347 RepID=UPI000E0D2224|nr:tail fiber domain-containing protein [Tritonibacter mobilis]
MAWVSSGTVTVTNGNATVTGAGTDWFGAMQNGWGFVGPDGRVYEILTVDSADTVTLKTPYQGATAAGQAYAVFPTGSHNLDLAAALQQLLSNYQGVYDTVGQGRFTGDIVFNADRDTGMGNPSSNEVGLKAGDEWQLRLKGGQASGAAVQSSPSDATAGLLALVGAFGWGGAALNPPNGDLDQIGAVGGVYNFEPSTENRPSNVGYGVALHMPTHAEAWTQIVFGRLPAGSYPYIYYRTKVATEAPTQWRAVLVLDENDRTPQNMEIRNSGPFLAITDVDTGVKHILSANSTAGHLYLKTDSAENMPNSAVLIETQGVRQMAIAKDDVEFQVPLKGNVDVKGSLGVGHQTSGTAAIEVGTGRTADGASYIDLKGDSVYSDYGTRLYRGAGESGPTLLRHRGTGNFHLQAEEAAYIHLITNSSGSSKSVILAPTGTFRPGADNEQQLGFSSFRWSQIYAASGTINTSDARTKTDIQDLDEAERRVAVAAKNLLKKYRIRDAVAEKGDAARWHFGVIAQELAAAFEAEGLDPWRYGVLCWDEWWTAMVEIPAETAPIMEEVEEEVTHTVTVEEPVLNEHGEPTGEVQQVEKEMVVLVKKQVETGELKILTEARTELQTFTSADEAPEGAEYHDRQGVRYDELFAFILAAI